MTENEFGLALNGEGERWTLDNRTRLRTVVADAMADYAKERYAAGRPDEAGRLRYIATEIRVGETPSKKSLTKSAKHINVIEQRLVNGISITGV